jgi:hypothetical protein
VQWLYATVSGGRAHEGAAPRHAIPGTRQRAWLTDAGVAKPDWHRTVDIREAAYENRTKEINFEVSG